LRQNSPTEFIAIPAGLAGRSGIADVEASMVEMLFAATAFALSQLFVPSVQRSFVVSSGNLTYGFGGAGLIVSK